MTQPNPAQVPALVTASDGTNLVAIVSDQDALNDLIDRVAAEVSSEIQDLSTAAGRKRVASKAYDVSKLKVALDKTAAALKAEWLAKGDAVDASRRDMRARLDAIRDEVRADLTAWEDAEKRRIEAHQGALEAIRVAGTTAMEDSAESIRTRLDWLEGDAPDRDWQEFAEQFIPVHRQAVASLRAALETVTQREAAAKELEERRAVEAAAAGLRALAEATATADAEASERAIHAERQRIATEKREAEHAAALAQQQTEADERAERERIDAKKREDDLRKRLEAEAEERAKAAEIKAAADERKRITDEAEERNRQAQAREADRTHRSKVRAQASAALYEHMHTSDPLEDIPEKLFNAIERGAVPYITVNY